MSYKNKNIERICEIFSGKPIGGKAEDIKVFDCITLSPETTDNKNFVNFRHAVLCLAYYGEYLFNDEGMKEGETKDHIGNDAKSPLKKFFQDLKSDLDVEYKSKTKEEMNDIIDKVRSIRLGLLESYLDNTTNCWGFSKSTCKINIEVYKKLANLSNKFCRTFKNFVDNCSEIPIQASKMNYGTV